MPAPEPLGWAGHWITFSTEQLEPYTLTADTVGRPGDGPPYRSDVVGSPLRP